MAGIRADFDVGISQRSKAKVQSELNNMFRRMSGRGAGFSINDKNFTQPLGRITASANEFTKSLEASNARVIAFGASVGVINAVTDAFKGLVMETIQFEKTLSEINVIMNSSASALRNFGDELFNVSRNTAQSFTIVAEAALEFSRQGLTMEETLRRTNDALILTRLTSLKATEAVSGLTAAVNAFGSAGLTTTEIIDKLAAVDVNFAVSSEDLIHALERTGAVAISAGVELDNLIGLVTALQQNTARGGSVIGNGLKTIFTRIQRPRSLRQLEEMNIAVRDLTGAVLPADKILQNIAKTFDSLSQAQQSNLVQFSAGIFQANIFRATLADLSKQQNIFSKASDIAADAAGNAAVKNAALNKTLSAMISQTQSSVRELAGALGEVMLEDSLKGWTKGFKFLVDGLTNALDNGEGKGSDFAKGFFKGLGNVLTGPVAIAIGVVFVKLLANVAKFAGQSLKDVLGVTTEKEKMLKMEQGIIEALGRNKHIQQALNNLEGDRLAQEEFMLKVIEAQTNAMQEQKRLARDLARPLMERGIRPDLTASNVPSGGRPVDLDGDGQYDTFSSGGLIPQAVKKERQGAMKAGYTPGAVSSMNIDGLGTVIYNKAEKVKRFPGMRQPAIMPPEKSGAGKEYRQKFSQKHGFNPYASHGLVPNFASIQNDAGNMKLMGTGQMVAPQYIEKQISSTPGGQQILLNISSKTSSLKNKNWKISPDSISLGELLSALGITDINTTMPFDFVPGTTGKLRKLPKEVRSVLTDPDTNVKGDGTESMFLRSSEGEGYTSTGGVSAGEKPGEYTVDKTKRAPNANLDAYKPGSPAVEIKAGDLDLHGVVKKSIRRYSNDTFRNAIRNEAGGYLYDERPNAVYPDMTNHQVAEELINTVNHLEEEFIIERLSELAKNGGWSPVGMTETDLQYLLQNNKLREHLRGSGFTASDADKELLNNIGFSKGFIPNFTSSKDYEKIWTSTINTTPEEVKKYSGDITIGNLNDYITHKTGQKGHLHLVKNDNNKNAFINSLSSIKDGYLSRNKYSKAEAETMVQELIDHVDRFSGKDFRKEIGLDFENNFRTFFGVGAPSSAEPHMDFQSGSLRHLEGSDIAEEYGLNTYTAGDAYRGRDGHAEAHFIAKYLRETLSNPKGSRTYDFSSTQGKKLKQMAESKRGIFGKLFGGGTVRFNNVGTFNDIIGHVGGKDEQVTATETLDKVLAYAPGIANSLDIAKGAGARKIKFSYKKDYMDPSFYSLGYIPNFKKLYQAYVGSTDPIGPMGGFRSNRHGSSWYFDSPEGADKSMEDWRKKEVRLPSGGLSSMYLREYQINDSNLKEMMTGVYSSNKLMKLRALGKKFLSNNELPSEDDIAPMGWYGDPSDEGDEYLYESDEDFEAAYDEMKGRLGAHSGLLKTQRQESLWVNHIAGTKMNPMPLASYKKDGTFGSGYIIPDLGSGHVWRDGWITKDDRKIRDIFSKNLNKHLIERKYSNKYLENLGFMNDLSVAATDPEKGLMSARQRGFDGLKDYVPDANSGYVPNYIGFNVPDGAHEMIDQFNAIIAGNATGPASTRTKDLIGEDLYDKAKYTPESLTPEEEVQVRIAREQIKEAQMAQKSKMILLLKQMQQMGMGKLYFGGGGKISPHAMSGYFPFDIDQIIGVINNTGLKSKGFIPSFSRNENIHLYRGTKFGLEKAIADRPNPPQFMFDRLFAAKTKKEFIDAVINMGIRHSQGAYSLSYNDGVKAATLEQIRGYEKLPEGKVHHGGYIYNRPTREDHERVEMGLGEHYPSGFVSRSVDPAVAQRFASALDQTGRRDSSLRGHIEDRVVNTSRIFDQEKIEKYIDRFGLGRVQKFLKKGMRENTLKELHLNLHKFRKKVPSTDPLDMFSPNAGESERSIGMSGGGLTHDEMEITQIWGKHSPYLDWHKGLVPNFVRYDKSRGGVENWEAIPDNRVGRYGGFFTAAEVEKMRNDGWARTDEKGWHFVGGGRAGVDHVEKAEREARRKLAEAQGMMRGGGKMIVNNKTGEMFHGMDHQQIAQENNLYDNGGLPSHFLKTHMGTNLYDSRANKGQGGYVRKMFASLREATISAGVLSSLKKIAEENALILLRDDMHSEEREGDVLYDPRGILGDPVFSSGFIPNYMFSPMDILTKPYNRIRGLLNKDKVKSTRENYYMEKQKGWGWRDYEREHLNFLAREGVPGLKSSADLKYGPSSAVDGYKPVPLNQLDDSEIIIHASEAKSGAFRGSLVGDKFGRLPYENIDDGSALWSGGASPFSNNKAQTIRVMGHLVANSPIIPGIHEGLIPNFYKLNRRNLSDGDKMSDRQRLLAMWQAKMDEKAPYAKKILKGTGARIELDPIISELNGQANAIWNELQKLIDGEDYTTTFPFEIPNFVDLEKVKALAQRGVGGEKANAQRILDKRTIKSKNMFHDIILDAFLDNPNQDYPPGTSIIDHLISLGYDENQIRSAAKNPKGYTRGYKGLIPNFIFPPPSSWMPSSSSGDWRKRRKKSETQSSSPVETPGVDGPRPGPSIYPANHSLDALTPQDPSRFDARLPFEIYRYVMTMGENSENIHDQMIAHQQGDSLNALISYTSVDALRNKYKEVAGKHYRSGGNRGIFNRFILDQSDNGLIGDVVGNQFISSRALLNHYKGFQGIDDNLYGKYKRYTTSRGPGGPEQTLFRGLVPNFSAAERVRKSQKRRVAGDGEYVSSGIRQSDALLAEKIFDYMIGNISGLSRKFGFDKQTLGFRATSEDLAQIVRASKTTTNRKNLSNLVGGEANLDRILRDIMTNHTEAILLARGQLKEEVDPLMEGAVARGLIPSFSNPLRDAINREKAAGIPESMIRLDRSSQLMGPQNPMGLAVINTRDEPQGVQQGINRARAMGIDPRKHGMQVPNFASGELSNEVQEMLKDYVAEKILEGIQKALDSGANVRSAGKDLSNVDFSKAGFDSSDNNFIHSGAYIKSELEKGDAKESLRVTEHTKTRASEFKLRAEQKLKSLEKNPQGTEAEAEQIGELNKVIAGLESLENALDEHANSIRGDTKEHIRELGEIKNVSKQDIRSAAEKGSAPKIKRAIDEGNSKEANAIVLDEARAKLSKDEEAWRRASGSSKDALLDKMRDSRKDVLKLQKSQSAIDKETAARENGLQRLFYFQSMISMANGFLEQMAETGEGTTKTLANLGIAASDSFAGFLQAKELGREAAEAMGVKEGEGFSLFGGGKEKRAEADEEAANRVAMGHGGFLERMQFGGGLKNTGLAGVRENFLGGIRQNIGQTGRAFKRMIPVAGQLYAGFNALDSGLKFVTKSMPGVTDAINKTLGTELSEGDGVMGLFKSQADIAATNIEKLSKASDAAAKALDAVVNSGKNQEEISKLEALGARRTIKQDRELHKLKIEQLKGDNSLNDAIKDLTDSNVVGSVAARQISAQMDSMTSSGRTMEETLRILNLTLQRNIQLESGKKLFDENLEENFDFFSPAAIGGGIASGIAATLGTILTGTGVLSWAGAGLIAGSGAIGAGVGEGIAAGTAEDHMIDGKLVEGTERSLTELNDMVGAMRGRAFELHQGLNQGLYGGDTDAAGNIRSDKAKRESRDYNLMLIRKAQKAIEEGGDEDDAEEILKGLRGSKGMGEVSSVQLQQAIIDAIKSGGDMEDTLMGLGKGEAFAISHGLLGGMLQMGEKDKAALSEAEFRKQQAETNMKNLDIQKKILRSHEMMLSQQAHELEMKGKSLILDHEIEKSKQALLEKHGLLLNSVSVETEARHASETATQKHNEKMMSIRNAEEKELMARVREYSEGENMATRFSNNANYQAELNKLQKDLESKEMTQEQRSELENKVKDMQAMGAGGQAIMDRQLISRILAGQTIAPENSERADRLISEGFTSVDGPKTAIQMQGHNEKMLSEFFGDANIGPHGDAKKAAQEFFKNYASDIEGQVDAGDAITTFIDSFKDVQEASVRAAIILMSEEVGMFAPSDAGAGLDKLQDFLSKSAKDREKAQKDFESELAKNKEAFRSSSIDKNTMLGAAILNRDIVENDKIGELQGLMNKNLEGEAATQEVRNRLSAERIDILLKSKNFELRTLAFLEKDLQASAEESIKSLKQAQIKNQIFKSNQNILTASVSRALLEQEELDIANKDKEIKLAMLNNSEHLASASDSKVRSEILDAEITAKITEGKRKILENAGYSRMLAEAQSKTDLENARISEISAKHKLIAQVSNEEISKLVSAELGSKLSSSRTEALKAAESALQLQLNKEQTKKLQQANELLELSNKFTAMKNAEMAANRSSSDIRTGNQMQRQTDQFNMIAGARSALDMAAMTGNADDKAEAANQIADVERSITGRSGALTALAKKMAEVEVAASSLSADLAGNLFDGVRSGFGTLLTDIATGAETAGDAWEKFGLGVAKQLLDRVMEHNIDKMMSNLTYAFTGVKNDPATQQKLLATATSKQTTATNKLTRALERRKNNLGKEIKSEDEGGGFPLGTIDPAKISDLMSNLGSLKMSAGAAAEALDGLVIKANSILSQRDKKIPEAEKAHSAAIKKLEEGGGKELERKIAQRDIRQSRIDKLLDKGDTISANIEAAKKQRENLLQQGGGMKGGYSNEDMILAAYLKGADEEGGATHASTINELAKMLEMQDMGKGIRAADRPGREEYIRRAEGMLPEDDGEADGLAINSYYWKKGGAGEGLHKNTDTWDDDWDLQVEGIVNARKGQVAQDIRDGGPYLGDANDDGTTNLFNQGKVKAAYDDASSGEKLNNQLDSLNQQIKNLEKAREANQAEFSKGDSVFDLNAEISALENQIKPLRTEVSNAAEALRQLRVASEQVAQSSQASSVPLAKTVPAARGEYFGGQIQHFHDGGFVRGEPGRDKVPAMLTAGEYVIPKDMMQAFKEGGKAESRVVAGAKGAAEMVTMNLVAREIADAVNGEPEDKAPTFDMKKLNTVDIGSDVSISRGDPRMSARAMAKDPVMKEYKDYLLKKASFDVQKKNEKFQERMGMLGTVVGAISSFAISQVSDLLAEPINNLVAKGDNFIRGTMGLGDHGDKFRHDSFPEGFNYRDIEQKGNNFTVGTKKNKHKWIKDKWVPIKKAMGGQIPAMLTAGEAYIPAEMAKKIGYDSLNRINKEGIVQGPGGIDNVGPVGLNPGDFIIRKSSTDKLLNANPNGLRDSLMGGGFTRRAVQGYYDGGMAGDSLTVPAQSLSPRRSNFDTSVSNIAEQEISSVQEKNTSQGASSATTNNINVSVKIDSSGRETVESSTDGEGSYQREKDLSMKIKSAVLDVIRQEKRVGGELS